MAEAVAGEAAAAAAAAEVDDERPKRIKPMKLGFSLIASGMAITGISSTSFGNLPPTDLRLDNDRVREEQYSGSRIGEVKVTDPDDPNGKGIYRYDLVEGNGSSGNHLFFIYKNSLMTADRLNYETNASHQVRIRVTDEHGAEFEKSVTVQVLDYDENTGYKEFMAIFNLILFGIGFFVIFACWVVFTERSGGRGGDTSGNGGGGCGGCGGGCGGGE